MRIVTRGEWGARPPKTAPVSTDPVEAWLHHTAGEGSGAAYMRSMQRFHQDERGWNDIAYNFVVDPDTLTVFEGRGGGIRPGAQKGHNSGTVAICVMGDYRTRPVTGGLLDTLAELMVHLHSQGWAPALFDGGHRDAPGQSTTCPGRLADHIDDINSRIGDDVTREEALDLLGLTEWEVATLKKIHKAFADNRADVGNVQGRLVRYGKANRFPSDATSVPDDVVRKGDTVTLN